MIYVAVVMAICSGVAAVFHLRWGNFWTSMIWLAGMVVWIGNVVVRSIR